MSLKDPSLILRAWVVAPLLVGCCSAALGLLVARVAGRAPSALTIPVGFLTGIVLIGGFMRLGLSGTPASALLALLALAAALWLAMPLRTLPGRARSWARRPDVLAAAAAALAGFAIALAPLVGSGRAGVLGYVLNNDPAIHSSLVELLAEHGQPVPPIEPESSFSELANLPNENYPTGGHAWPVFATEATALDAFFVWAPLIALACAMLSLTAFAAMRRFGAGRATSATAGALLPAGFLTYSYVAQGSAKEVVTAVAVYVGAVAVAECVESRAGPRALIAPGIAAGAALFSFGAGAGIWVGPVLVPLLLYGLWQLRARRPRPRTLVLGLAALAILTAVTVPLVQDAVEYVNAADEPLRNPAQVGNLLEAVPWNQAFNIWFAYDYRIDPPERETLSYIGVWLAGILGAIGLAAALWRRRIAIPLAVVAGVIGALVISKRYAIYMDAKSYMVLAPALGLATAAGVAALITGGRVRRAIGTAVGVVVALGVLGSAYMVYSGAWVSPRERFEELADIADRYEGRAPIFLNEREEYGYYWLRDLAPFEPWGSWQPGGDPGFAHGPLYLPHTPDFDDFEFTRIQRFPLLVERKSPGGSRPAYNYRSEFETKHYRVWSRRGPAPVAHIALGLGTLDNDARLNCGRPDVRRTLAQARASGSPLVASVPRTKTTLVVEPELHWADYFEEPDLLPPPGMLARRHGRAEAPLYVARGRYEAWIQGSFGPGVALHIGDQAVGEAFGDLGLPQWQPLGEFDSDGAPTSAVLISLSKPRLQSGRRRTDLTGQVVIQPVGPERRLRRVPAARARSLCGKNLDWVEVVPRRADDGT